MQPETIAKNLFYEFDIDSDGHISYNEFREMMNDLYSNDINEVEVKIKQDFKNVDINGSGKISIKEMAEILKAHLQK